MKQDEIIQQKVKEAVIRAGSTYREDQKAAFIKSIQHESVPNARYTLENLLENAEVAMQNFSPLCDDTGVPHIYLEVGGDYGVSGHMLESIQKGVALGLRTLPGRPMAVKGNDVERIEQSAGLDEDPGALSVAPIIIKRVEEEGIKLHVLLQGGGPEIRGRTNRIFHQRKLSVVIDEVVDWALEEVSKLGCTPCVPAIGIGRSHFEAASLMLEAMIHGNFGIQSEIEQRITDRINTSQVGPLGLSGDTTALATFLRVGPQRASGVRIACLRLCCTVEPRVASVKLSDFLNKAGAAF